MKQVLSVAHNMHSVLSLDSSPVEDSSELHPSRDLLRDVRRYRLHADCCSRMRNCHPHLHFLPVTLGQNSLTMASWQLPLIQGARDGLPP